MLQELVSFGRRGRNGKPVTAVGSLAHRGSKLFTGLRLVCCGDLLALGRLPRILDVVLSVYEYK